MKYIFGYTCFIDGSARGLPPPGNVFFQMKSRDTFAPIGPVHRHRRRDPRSAEPRHHAHEQRRGDAEVQHQRHGAPDPALSSNGCRRSTRWSPATSSPPAPITAGLNSFMDGDKIELTVEKIGTLKFNVKDELKRTWARTTRLQHKESGKEGAHTPPASRSARQRGGRRPPADKDAPQPDRMLAAKEKAPRFPATPSSQEQPGCRLLHCILLSASEPACSPRPGSRWHGASSPPGSRAAARS